MTDKKDKGVVRTMLSGLIETLAEMDENDQRRRSGHGSARSGRKRLDYGLSVGIGPQAGIDGRDGTGIEREEVPESIAETDHAATVSPTETGQIVTIDLPDVDPRELSAGVGGDGRTLVVADDEGVVERVPLPHAGLAVADASFNNGILDVWLEGTRDE